MSLATALSPDPDVPATVAVMDEIDIFIPTTAGADVRRACGCTERLDANWDAWILVDLCPEHDGQTTKIDGGLMRLLDPEIDRTVAAASSGRRPERLRPRDETRSKR